MRWECLAEGQLMPLAPSGYDTFAYRGLDTGSEAVSFAVSFCPFCRILPHKDGDHDSDELVNSF